VSVIVRAVGFVVLLLVLGLLGFAAVTGSGSAEEREQSCRDRGGVVIENWAGNYRGCALP